MPVGRRYQHAPLGPMRKKIKEHADDEQRDREMNQHDVLRVFCEKDRLDVERVHGFSSLTARSRCRSFSDESSRSTEMFPACFSLPGHLVLLARCAPLSLALRAPISRASSIQDRRTNRFIPASRTHVSRDRTSLACDEGE